MIIMIGATVVNVLNVAAAGIAPALITPIVGLLAAFVAYGRWRWAAHRTSSGPSVLQPTN